MKPSPIPVTNANFDKDRDGLLARLRRLLSTPPLQMVMDGAGIENGPLRADFDQVVMMPREELRLIIDVLEIKAGDTA